VSSAGDTAELIYTHALWRVKEGKADEFVAAWNRLPEVFAKLAEPPVGGTLIKSLDDPHVFYSFGPWRGLAAVSAMRADSDCQEAFRRLVELCDEAQPGAYRLIADIKL
jgi:hypothetical protein